MVERELIHNFIKKKYISCDNLKSIIEKEESHFKMYNLNNSHKSSNDSK